MALSFSHKHNEYGSYLISGDYPHEHLSTIVLRTSPMCHPPLGEWMLLTIWVAYRGDLFKNYNYYVNHYQYKLSHHDWQMTETGLLTMSERWWAEMTAHYFPINPSHAIRVLLKTQCHMLQCCYLNINVIICLCSCKFQTVFTRCRFPRKHLLSYYHNFVKVADVWGSIYMTISRQLLKDFMAL